MARVLEEERRQRLHHRQLQAVLTDFRIYWDTLGSALMGRDLVLIDADNIKGQRSLFLFDPDQFRVPIIMRRRSAKNNPWRALNKRGWALHFRR